VIDDLRAKFLPRFLDSAQNRLIRARGGLDRGDRTAVLHELHALAGEAGILELTDVARLARGAELHAKRWVASESADDAGLCDASLSEIETAVRALTP
jgi:HPt (histidine-containing phosphotransfer) domain-containing protein